MSSSSLGASSSSFDALAISGMVTAAASLALGLGQVLFGRPNSCGSLRSQCCDIEVGHATTTSTSTTIGTINAHNISADFLHKSDDKSENSQEDDESSTVV